MSRQSYPKQLRDHLGNEVRLPAKPFATGGEGAIFEVTGHPDLVAKLYSKPQDVERCDKLRAMARLCSPDLLKFAAWPTATLHNGTSTAVMGILMPRIVDYKEIHHLYSVAQRRKDFPEVDWGFLLHTARNCAIAFESVHNHGHVVGDVNQKNVMVSKKGIIALVDCDSFQVKDGTRIFRCGVGVPEYTPPELQRSRFSELDRDANHDLFGLAVLVFHLLMMGRHPFSGVPQGDFDLPIPKAIQDGLYAYMRNPTRLKPPPHGPPVTMLDATTRDLFERAFRSRQRPTATEWRGVLDASMKGLQRCRNDSRHSYLAAAVNCPWCQLIATDRTMYFIPGQGATGATLRIEDIRHLIQKLTSMRMEFPVYARPKPLLPIQVMFPAGLRTFPKPALEPFPSAPVFRSRPALRLLPAIPATPLAPELRPYPPAPVKPPLPKQHAKPEPVVYPPVRTPDPPDPFLSRFCIAGVVTGMPVLFIARPVGMIVILAFGAWWLIMKATDGLRRNMAQKALEKDHAVECAQLDEKYREQIRYIDNANKKLMDAWETACTAREAEHVRLCKVIDEENRRRLAPWEAAKAAIEAEYQRVTLEVEQANRRILSDWEAENAALQAEHDQKCREIDTRNRQLIDKWNTANAPWNAEQKRWCDRVSVAEAKIRRLEGEFMAHRSTSAARFQQRKTEADEVLKSHNASQQDYEREQRQARKDSKKIQLAEYLDKRLIRNANLKGFTSDRLLALESFGIETAKDVDILNYQKVPGIGPVLSERLFEWRNNLARSFQPKHGLPESEKNRINNRYAPVFRSLAQVIETAIRDLEMIAATHLFQEAERSKAIEAAVQELAVAEAHVRAMQQV